MKISRSSKRYIEFKHINDQLPTRIPITRANIGASASKIKAGEYVYDPDQCNCEKAPNCGSTPDYPWTPVEFEKRSAG